MISYITSATDKILSIAVYHMEKDKEEDKKQHKEKGLNA